MKATFLFFLLTFSSVVYAQVPDSGNWLIGADIGTIGLYPTNSSTIRYGALSVGKLLSTKTLIGISVPLNWYTQKGPGSDALIKSSSYGVMPFVRYYLSTSRLRPYLSWSVGYVHGQYSSNQNTLLVKASDGGLSYSGSVGVAYFVGRRFSVDGVLQYIHTPFQTIASSTFSQASDSRLGVSLRVQFFLGHK